MPSQQQAAPVAYQRCGNPELPSSERIAEAQASEAIGSAATPAQPTVRDSAASRTSHGTSVIRIAPDSTADEPPKLYLPACGALCDIFWWARRNT